MTDKPVVRPTSPARDAARTIYQACYAPADLADLLATAEGRSQIRRLPVAQFYFGFKQLTLDDLVKVLPHLTEEQWRGVMDLDLWSRDEADSGRFLEWQTLLLASDDAVARKLLRGTDSELWQLIIKRELAVHIMTDDPDPVPEPENREVFETPDENFLITLPEDPDEADQLKALLRRLYQLDPAEAALLILSALSRTSLEIEEVAYQLRRERTEELGFQDYFDAVEIYSSIDNPTELREKPPQPISKVEYAPVPVSAGSEGLLLVQAVTRLEQGEAQALMEEIFFVCNKLLSADRVSPGDPEAVQEGLRKALAGINLGLDWWSQGDLARALDGVCRFYLQSFFQLGRGLLLRLQSKARGIEPEPGSYEETVIEGLLESHPRQSVVGDDGSIRPDWITDRTEFAEIESFLESL